MNFANVFKSKEEIRQEKLKQFELDSESIKEFRSQIKIVDKDESDSIAFSISSFILHRNSKISNEMVIDYVLNGANVNYIREKTPKRSLLELAIRNNNFEIAKVLIKAGVNIYVYDTELNNVYIKECIKNNMYDLLEILILLGIDVNYKNIYGESSLNYAKKIQKKCEEQNKKGIEDCIKVLEQYTNNELPPELEILKMLQKKSSKEETLEDVINDMEKELGECYKLLGENYQKELRKK